MKKTYFLIAMLALASSIFANTIQYNVSQNSWRWRNNDGSETKATWKAAQNTPVNYGATGTIIRLRIEMVNTSKNPVPCQAGEICNQPSLTIAMHDSLQFSTTPADAASWKNIGLDSRLPFVIAKSDSYITQGEVTSPQLTGNSHAFSPGEIMVSDSVPNFLIPVDNRSEIEWAIKGTSNLKPATTYYFRQRRVYKFYDIYSGMPDVTQYPVAYPSLTTSSVLAVKFNNFSVSSEGKTVKLEWSAVSEQNDDYFNTQRSADGRTWETISEVNSKGTASVITNYTAYDYSPLPGVVYYRIQYNEDGSISYSDVKSVSMNTNNKAIVSVMPNPARSAINFKIENVPAQNIQAILTDVGGRILYKQLFENIQAGSMNKLNLQHLPPPGLYILKLKGEGLSESIKVVVQ